MALGRNITKNASSTATFNFNGGLLQAGLSSTTYFPALALTTANVRNGGAKIDTNGFNITIGQALIHSGIGGDNAIDGGLAKSGLGTLTLSGANTYNGATAISAGNLTIASTGALANTVISAVNTGSTFAVTPLAAGTVNLGNTGTVGAGASLNLGSGTVFSMVNAAAGGTANLVQEGTFAGNALTLDTATLNFELSGATADKLAVTGALATASVTGVNTINLTPLAAPTSGTYNLITTANLAGGLDTGGTFAFASGLTAGAVTFGGSNYLVTLNNSANTESVTVGATSALTWTGQVLGNGVTDVNWTTGANSNWAMGTTPVGFVNGNAVTFQDANTVATGNVAAPSLAVTIQAGGVSPGSTTFDNSAVNYTVGGGAIAGSGALTKLGTGAVTLSGANTYTGDTTVQLGTLNMTGSLTGNGTATTGSNLLYGTTAGNSVVNVSGDIVNYLKFQGATNASANAAYIQTAGVVNFTSTSTANTNNFVASAGYGYMAITGGTLSAKGRFGPSNGSATTGVMYIGGTGTLDHTGGEWLLMSYSNSGNGGRSMITVDIGGTLNRVGATNNFGLNMDRTNGYAVLNITGGQVLTSTKAITFGNSTGSGITGTSGFINLAAGTLQIGTNILNGNTSGSNNSAYLNFSGGTLKAQADLTSAIPVTAANQTFTSTVYGPIDNVVTSHDFVGGLTVDTNTFATTLANNLVAPSSDGVGQSSLTVTGGSGYIGAPMVQFIGGTLAAGGAPAAGYAVVSGGAVTEIVITAPGSYTTAPTVSLTGGGGSGAGVAVGALVANSSGGLTKNASGTLTLTGTNTYTGATTISGGTLQLGNGTATGSLSTSSAISVGTGATLAINQSDTVAQGGDFSTSAITGPGGFRQSGPGTTVLNLANGYSGATEANAGTLQLAFSGGVTADILNASSSLTMGGGTLKLTGTGTQTVNGLTTIASTTSSITLAANETLTLGALTSAGAGSVLNFNTLAGGANATTTTVGTSIITLTGQTPGTAVNPGFTVTDAGGFGLATVNGSNQVVRLIGGTLLLPPSGASSTIDYLVDNNAGGSAANGSSSLIVTASQSAKSITVDTTAANGSLSLDTGVVLSNNTWNFGGAGSNTYQIAGNTSGAGLNSVASNDTININNFSTGLITFTSPILANGTNNVVLAGTGTTVFSGINTYTGSTTISSGQLTIDEGSVATSSTIVNNAALEYKLNTNARTYANGISGSGSLTKSGTNTLTLTSASTNYTGATTISGGTLVLSQTNAFASAVTVNSGTTLQYSPTGTSSQNGVGAISLLGTMTYAPAGNFFQTLGTSGVNKIVTVSGGASIINISPGGTFAASTGGLYLDGGLQGSSALTVNATTNGFGLVLRTAGSIYSGTMTVNGNPSTTAGAGSGLVIGFLASGGVNATMPNANLIINGTLELGNSTSGMGWAAGTVIGQTFGMNALSGSGVVVANMQTAASTRTLSVGNNGGTGSFSGVIANGTNNTLSFTKTGAGTQTLSGTNTYSGGTTITGGTLTLGNASALGTAAASVTGGSLNLGSQLITNAVSTGVSGTLTGIGSTGAATLAGSMTPGGSGSGLITLASASIASTSSIALQLAAIGSNTRGVDYDAITVAGSLALDGTITVSLNGLTPAAGQTFDLIDSMGLIDVTNFTIATDLVLPALSGGLAWDTSTFATNGVVSIINGDPYIAWAALTGATGGKGGDTDGDGKNNFYEFAFDGNPTSGANDGKIVGKIATVGGNQVLTLTLPVRNGATFSPSSGDQLSALIDGIYYRIEGDVDLSPFADTITEVTGGDATTIQAGLPGLSVTGAGGWTYRTFRAPGTVPVDPKAFLRAKISE